MKLEELLSQICLLTFICGICGFFGVICVILRFVMGVTWRLEIDPGPPLRRSWWGDAGINSVSCRGMAQVIEYADGWLIRVHPTFVFGVLWFPKKGTEIGPVNPGGWFVSAWRRLEHGSDEVILLGHLASFVTSQPESTIEETMQSSSR